jgi:hypothetical protein
MEIIKFFSNLPEGLRCYILDFLEFDYYEYFFYMNPLRRKNLCVIKYPFFQPLNSVDDDVWYIKRNKKRKDRSETI